MLSPIVHCHSHLKLQGNSLLSKICFVDQDKFLLLIVALPGVTQTQWQLQVNDFQKVNFAHTFIKIFDRSFYKVWQTYLQSCCILCAHFLGNKIEGLSENN